MPDYVTHGDWVDSAAKTVNIATRRGAVLEYGETSKTVNYRQVFHYTPAHKNKFGEYLMKSVHDHSPNYRPYQITFTYYLGGGEEPADGANATVYKNFSPDEIGAVLESIDEDYHDRGFNIGSITIRYTTQQTPTLNVAAKYGEGVSKRHIVNRGHTGYWLLDLKPSGTECILNAYVTWLDYRMSQNMFDQLFEKVATDKHNKSVYALTNQVNNYKHNYKISSEDTSTAAIAAKDPDARFYIIPRHQLHIITQQLDPAATLQICCLVYDMDHVTLLAHQQYLSPRALSTLDHKLRTRHTIDIIRKKKPKTDMFSANVADIESWREYLLSEFPRIIYKHVPIIICAIINNQQVGFRGVGCLDSFMQHILNLNQDLLIFMHYGAKYDHHILLETLAKYSNKQLSEPIEILDLNGSFISLTAHLVNGRSLEIRDSYRNISIPLRDFHNSLELTTAKMLDVDVVNVTQQQWMENDAYVNYCFQDCVVLKEGIEKYQQIGVANYGYNPMHTVSTSSFAKKLFYSRYYDVQQYPIYSLVESCHKYIEQAFKGGVSDLGFRGVIDEVYIYDFSSLYPWAGTQQLPYGKPIFIDGLNILESSTSQIDFLNMRAGVYTFTVIDTPLSIRRPYFRISNNLGYIAPYLINCSDLVATSPELLYMLKMGYTIRLQHGFSFPLAPHMNRFFTDVYTHKQQATAANNTGLRTLAKNVTVNGYGFMGFRKYDRSVTKVYGSNMAEEATYLKLNAGFQMAEYDGIHLAYGNSNVNIRDTNIAISTFITAYSRIRLHELITACDSTDVPFCYCDTDSVHVGKRLEYVPSIRQEFMGSGMGSNLGELKREYSDVHIRDAVYVAPKVYAAKLMKDGESAIDYMLKLKGVNISQCLAIDGKYLVDDNNILLSLNEAALDTTPTIPAIDKLYTIYNNIRDMLTDGNIIHTYSFRAMSVSRVDKVRDSLDVTDEIIMREVSGKYKKGYVKIGGMVYPWTICNNDRIMADQ